MYRSIITVTMQGNRMNLLGIKWLRVVMGAECARETSSPRFHDTLINACVTEPGLLSERMRLSLARICPFLFFGAWILTFTAIPRNAYDSVASMALNTSVHLKRAVRPVILRAPTFVTAAPI